MIGFLHPYKYDHRFEIREPNACKLYANSSWSQGESCRATRLADWFSLKTLSADDCVGQHFFVREFELAAGGDAAGEARDRDREGAQSIGNEQRGSVAFEVGVRGQDDLTNISGGDALREGFEGELVGSDPLERSQAAEQHVIDAVVGAGAFQRQQVAWLFHDTNQGVVAAWIAADGALSVLGLGEVEAGGAVSGAILGVADGVGEGEGFLGGCAQDVVGEALGRFGADAGQAAELVDEAVHDRVQGWGFE